MSITISDKAILLSDYVNLLQLINDILTSSNIDHHSDSSPLSSLNALKSKINEEGNLSIIKKDVLSFIQQNGYPFLIIIDMKINTNLDSALDNSKVIKTLLLSFIIIMQSEQFKDISCNLLILMDKKDYNQFKENHKHPQNILGILRTNDDRLNNIINEYTANNEKFKKNFNILITDAEEEPSLIKSELILFINMIKAKEKLKDKIIQKKPVSLAGPKIEAAQPADAILRAGQIIFKNGEAPSSYNGDMNLTDKEVYILGNFTSYTRLDVIERLLALLKAGFRNEINFKKNDTLILNIPEESIIDSTTPITLAQLMSKELLDYKNIKIKTTQLHYQMMQQSQGFSMIQRRVMVDDF